MAVAITVRDVPDEVRDELAARAARAGKSLQEYLRGMLMDTAARPAVDDVISRARARVDATGARANAESILAEARKALGGGENLKTMIESGRTKRVRGNNLVPIEFELFFEPPS